MQSASKPASEEGLKPGSAGVAAAIIAASVIAVYANSLSGPFVMDDPPSILGNPTLRHLSSALSPPAGALTVSGRPILNLSFALNYALGGTSVAGYHALNILIHFLGAWVLFGLARRTFFFSPLRERFASVATPCACLLSLLWALHPLQTESVTYVAQRAESLMGLFYLLTLYAFARGSEMGAPHRRVWFAASWVACLLGMATKEVMVSAPLIVLLYDRTFVSGSFRESFRRHSGIVFALALTWIPLAALVYANGNRGDTSAYGIGVRASSYWITQFPALVHYVGLSIWPRPLIFDYGTQWIAHPASAVAYLLVVGVLLAGTAYSLVQRPLWGFLGAWFFLILAPTSLIPGMRQTMADHRMYLALIPIVAIVASFLVRKFGRTGLVLGFAAAAALGFASANRNTTYRTEEGLWADTVARLPSNPYAQNNLGGVLRDTGHPDQAIPHFEEAIRLKPDYAQALNNLGGVLIDLGRYPEAIERCRAALRLQPAYADGHNNLGYALVKSGRAEEGIAELQKAIDLEPERAQTHSNLAYAYLVDNRLDRAIAEAQAAIRLKPTAAEAHTTLGAALSESGNLKDGISEFEEAVRLRPNDASYRCNLGEDLLASGRKQQAIEQFQEAARLDPRSAAALAALSQLGFEKKF